MFYSRRRQNYGRITSVKKTIADDVLVTVAGVSIIKRAALNFERSIRRLNKLLKYPKFKLRARHVCFSVYQSSFAGLTHVKSTVNLIGQE